MSLSRSFARWVAASSAMLAATLLACANRPLPEMEIETGPGAEITADGLHRVKNPLFSNAWVKPDANFASYDKVLLDPISVSYKRKPKSTRYRGTGSNFALTERQMEDFKRYFREAFENELSDNEYYELVKTPGPQALRVAAAIIDLVVKVPTQSGAGREHIYTSSTGEMTLLMELRDSLSGEILARVADRREARRAGYGSSDLSYSSAPANTGTVKRVFRRWAEILQARLDQIHELQPTAQLEDTDQ
jgi:hypothetical protein